ncbi:MAG: hypothetical protein ACO1TE_07495 [Prosthecobacter sp.]
MRTLRMLLGLGIVMFGPCLPGALAQDQARRFQTAYEARGEDFFVALFWLPETSKTIRSHIPGVDQWEGFEPGLWAKVPKTAKAAMLETLGKEWDALKAAERENRWRRLDTWATISADLTLLLSLCEGIEEFHQVCFEDPLLQPAYDWLLARRPKDFGHEHVGATLASGEMSEAWVSLMRHLLEKSPTERHACFARIADKLTPPDSAEPTEAEASAAAAAAKIEDAELRLILSLLSKLRMGDKHAAVKKLLPKLGALQQDAGDDNTEALVTIQIAGVELKGEFNFAKGGLVSHGFHSGKLPQDQAQAFAGRCIRILEELHGESERRIDMPGESDGPQDEIGLSFNWHKNKTLIGVDLSLQNGTANVGWGAQGE